MADKLAEHKLAAMAALEVARLPTVDLPMHLFPNFVPLLTLVESHVTLDGTVACANAVTEISLQQGAALTHLRRIRASNVFAEVRP